MGGALSNSVRSYALCLLASLCACGQRSNGLEIADGSAGSGAAFEGAGSGATAGGAASVSLAEACLPRCILELFDDCPFDGPCAAATESDETHLCYANGVRAQRQVLAPDQIVWTYTERDGTTPCATKTQRGNDYTYVRVRDGASVQMTVVSRDLRTAFCPDGPRTGVYPLPRCAALEAVQCANTGCD